MRFRTALAQMRGDQRPEVVHTATRGLGDRDPALREQILDVTKAEREPEIEPNRVMDGLGREPILIFLIPRLQRPRTSNKLPPA
jgi:hypothetical protein